MSQPPHDDDPDDDRTAIGNVRIPVGTRRDRAHLIVLAGESLGQMYRVDRAETVIGRASDADIRVQDDGVSRRHSKIVQASGEVWIEDMGSANGTYIEDSRVERRLLRDGDKIRIILKFTYADERCSVGTRRFPRPCCSESDCALRSRASRSSTTGGVSPSP
jgi:two-component system, cell cycle response regulator